MPQLFVTPPGLAREIVKRAQVEGKVVLEPSAGLGALARECIAQNAMGVYLVEQASACCEALRAAGFFPTQGAFLILAPPQLYERIVMNPPFADGADIDHVTCAFERWLAPGGWLVAIMAVGVKFRQDRKTTAFRALVEEHGEMEDLPEDAFESSGTSVRTVIVTLNK